MGRSLKPRPLPSTGVTRLLPHEAGCGTTDLSDFRHGPDRVLANLRLRRASSHRDGSPVVRGHSLQTCRRHYPGGPRGARSLSPCYRPGMASLPSRHRPSRPHRPVGSALSLSRLARRSLALRPACPRGRLATLSIQGFGHVVTSMTASITSGRGEPLPGGTCTHGTTTPPRRTMGAR